MHNQTVHAALPPDGDDFQSVSTTLFFSGCDNRSCANVSIVLDNLIEETETFTITLERPLGLDARITLNPVNGVVNIKNIASK